MPSVIICVACNRHFCWNHFCEHRETYGKYVDDAHNHQQPLSKCLAEFEQIENKLRSSIGNWEGQAVEDTRQSANDARKTLENLIQNYRSHFEDESSTIIDSRSTHRDAQLVRLEKLQNEYVHSLESIHIVPHYNQKRTLEIETISPIKESFSSNLWKEVSPICDPNMPKTRLGKRLIEEPLAESAVGNYWAIGASDEYLLAQEYENKQLTLFDRHGKRGISMTWHYDVVIRDIQWNYDLRQFFILLDKELILFNPVTRLFQEISSITRYQSNTFRRCTCRNDHLFISYWCQESAIDLIQISSWNFQQRWSSPVTCHANEFITCIQLNSKDQLALSIQDENNPLNRQFRFELRDLTLNILHTIFLDTDSGIFSRMTPLPDGYWALLNVDNNLVFILDEEEKGILEQTRVLHWLKISSSALITGAAQGIGRAIAFRLAKDGFNVAVNDIEKNSSKLNQVKQEIENIGRKSVAIIADVSQDKQVQSMMNNAREKLGNLNVVVANAGICQIKPMIEISADDWDKIFALNMRGVFLCYREAAKIMIEQGKGGKIIGACSTAGYSSHTMAAHYIASKWGVRGLTQATALELAKYNIKVNAYCPGITETDMMQSINEIMTKYREKQKEKGEKVDEVKNMPAFDRLGQPEDIANLVSFLASKDSDYITGQSIMVNGGAAFS
ncbi:unnamed protein product [Rotaria sordida]|uniref:Uncharacterized protein n=2 Tax=Rotaria sordida TaxID=392033 RepID=A0A815DA74_9BILA|nr:unnamed protein product [Rotaria sordida]